MGRPLTGPTSPDIRAPSLVSSTEQQSADPGAGVRGSLLGRWTDRGQRRGFEAAGMVGKVAQTSVVEVCGSSSDPRASRGPHTRGFAAHRPNAVRPYIGDKPRTPKGGGPRSLQAWEYTEETRLLSRASAVSSALGVLAIMQASTASSNRSSSRRVSQTGMLSSRSNWSET